MTSTAGGEGHHTFWLRFRSGMRELSAEERARMEEELPDGWRMVDHVEIMEADDPGDPEIGLEPWSKGNQWRYTTLEVDAYMSGPSDRWEADREFRDLAQQITGARPGPGTGWSLRSAPGGHRE